MLFQQSLKTTFPLLRDCVSWHNPPLCYHCFKNPNLCHGFVVIQPARLFMSIREAIGSSMFASPWMEVRVGRSLVFDFFQRERRAGAGNVISRGRSPCRNGLAGSQFGTERADLLLWSSAALLSQRVGGVPSCSHAVGRCEVSFLGSGNAQRLFPNTREYSFIRVLMLQSPDCVTTLY